MISKLINSRCIFVALLTVAMLSVTGGAKAADAWPERPIKVLVPYTAGGPVDTLTRMLMENVAKYIDETVVIENRPGANTQVATGQLARSAPDGYTFGVVPAAYTTNQVLVKNLAYKPSDLMPVSHIVDIPLFLFIPASVPADNVHEFVSWARDQQPNYASTGPGSTGHLLGEMFSLNAGLNAVHIAYQGSAQAMPNLMEGMVSYFFDPAIGGMPHVRAGKLKVLAVSRSERCPCAPDVPTMAESGFPEIVQGSWLGVMAPKGTPDIIVQRMAEAMAVALRDPAFMERLETLGFGAVGSSPADFQALLDSDINAYEAIARSANISLSD